MPAPSALLEYLLDQLAPIGQPQGRRMFSGHGLYLDGLFIGIIADETLYLKADELSQPVFQAAGVVPFTYSTPQLSKLVQELQAIEASGVFSN
jgi:DNA transformation protein